MIDGIDLDDSVETVRRTGSRSGSSPHIVERLLFIKVHTPPSPGPKNGMWHENNGSWIKNSIPNGAEAMPRAQGRVLILH